MPIFDAVQDWIVQHDQSIDEVTIWCLAVGFAILGTVELVTWLALANQHDRTSVGRTLKHKKLAYAVICYAMSGLYSMTLWAYYGQKSFTVWERFGIRILVIVGILAACLLGVRFVGALHAEHWGRARAKARDAP